MEIYICGQQNRGRPKKGRLGGMWYDCKILSMMILETGDLPMRHRSNDDDNDDDDDDDDDE